MVQRGLMLGAALVRAVHVVLVGRFTTGRAIRPLQLTTVQTLVGTALFLPAAAHDLPTLVRADPATWAQLVYLALFCSVFAFLAQTWAVQRTSASRASLLLGTEPVWAVAVGAALGGEHLTPLTGIGAALMVAGTYWGQAVERAHRSPPGPLPPSSHSPDKDSACPTAPTTTAPATTAPTGRTPTPHLISLPASNASPRPNRCDAESAGPSDR